MPMEYIVPSLQIVAVTKMVNRDSMEERLAQILELEEDCVLPGFHEQVQKAWEKAWHDHHIKKRTFKNEYLVLIYDCKFTNFPGKFQMHWLGPYIIKDITYGGAVQLTKLNEELIPGKTNRS